MGKKKGNSLAVMYAHHARWVACSFWVLTAGGDARLCQSSIPPKRGDCTSERHLVVPAKCSGSLSGGHNLGFG